MRAERPNHAWSYDFDPDRSQHGRVFRVLLVLDELARRRLPIVVPRRFRSDNVLHCVANLFAAQGRPSIFVPTTGPNSSQQPCVGGLIGWA